ncbi:MAG: hypothetical protein K9J37_23550 [Saprospiraceae bacterium]|nr:hypothetical protein [Saprospiraceae bacterium]MCF8252902.1 hypothetical protein [Saprospiraceae bacterium]MCF8314450.1 hypothetical protein [Saprospiraceae bacterium]MCF8443328.1 hypothetical protein [Saprospiraceae bacterium]
MKNIFIATILLLSFNIVMKAQDACESNYLAFRQGVSFELTNYDKKGKISSIQQQKINNVEATDDGFKANTSMVLSNEKGKTLSEGSYNLECKNGVVYLDMSSMLDPRMMEGFKDMEMEISGAALEFPSNLKPGQTLSDGDVNVKAMTGGLTLMNITMSITNRKVESTEIVTTPAGTFECAKISQDSELKSIIKKKFKSVSWYAIGVGLVKSENMDEKGNVESSTLLTKFEK